jgi:hypothetical protein
VEFEPITPWGNSGGYCKSICAKFTAKIGFCEKQFLQIFRSLPIFATPGK